MKTRERAKLKIRQREKITMTEFLSLSDGEQRKYAKGLITPKMFMKKRSFWDWKTPIEYTNRPIIRTSDLAIYQLIYGDRIEIEGKVKRIQEFKIGHGNIQLYIYQGHKPNNYIEEDE